VSAYRAYITSLERYLTQREDDAAAMPDIELSSTVLTTVRLARRMKTATSGRQLLERQREAAALLEPIVAAGLEQRVDRFLLPPAVIPPAFKWAELTADEAQHAFSEVTSNVSEQIADWLTWNVITRCTETLGGKLDGPIRVCECSAVFRARRSDARACDLCRGGRSVAPVLGMAPIHRGEIITVRVPHRFGDAVIAWRAAAIGLSKETGDVVASSRTNIKGSRRDRSRRSRRLK
jgi:hypothetical protein